MFFIASRSVFVRSSIGSRSCSVHPSIVHRSRIEEPSNSYQSINGLLTECLPTYNDIVANT